MKRCTIDNVEEQVKILHNTKDLKGWKVYT